MCLDHMGDGNQTTFSTAVGGVVSPGALQKEKKKGAAAQTNVKKKKSCFTVRDWEAGRWLSLRKPIYWFPNHKGNFKRLTTTSEGGMEEQRLR